MASKAIEHLVLATAAFITIASCREPGVVSSPHAAPRASASAVPGNAVPSGSESVPVVPAPVALDRPDHRAPRQVYIAGGPYLLDSFDPKLAHEVTVEPFWIDVTEVTAGQFAQCVEAGACSGKRTVTPSHELQADSKKEMGFRYSVCTLGSAGKENHPINCVLWEQARSFCEWAGGRLPTIAEWEFTARGSEGRDYPWGNQPYDGTRGNTAGLELERYQTDIARLALASTSDGFDDGAPLSAPVGSYPPGATPDGVYDLVGNVLEWLADQECRNPPCSAPQRAIRGSSWFGWAISTNASASADAQHFATEWLGFRCARSEPGH